MARRPDRITNLGAPVATSIDGHVVRLVFLGDSNCRGVQQFALKKGASRGTGKTALEWVELLASWHHATKQYYLLF
jgi:hypothetical protein